METIAFWLIFFGVMYGIAYGLDKFRNREVKEGTSMDIIRQLGRALLWLVGIVVLILVGMVGITLIGAFGSLIGW